MKQILHNTLTSLAIISLFSLAVFLFFSAAFQTIEAAISNIQQSIERESVFTYHLPHY